MSQHTYALRSVDAVRVDAARSAYTFDLGSTIAASRVILGSIEFAMSQPPVRAGRDKVYVSQGVRLANQTLNVRSSQGVATATLPRFRNEATASRAPSGRGVRVTTQHPHGIGFGDCVAFLLCDCEGGRVDATDAIRVDALTFDLPHVRAAPGRALLGTDAIASTAEL